MKYKAVFKGKRITIMGLGLLGRGLGDAQFLAECGAELIVTDLKSAEALKPSVEKLSPYPNITFVLGEHRLKDFSSGPGSSFGGLGPDMILKAAGVPLDSPYIAEAKKNGIPVEMSASLFAQAAQGVTIVGITGTRGKSTVTHLLFEILKKSLQRSPRVIGSGATSGHARATSKVVLGGNVKDVSTLALLSKVKSGDIAVLELDSWQLQGFHEVGVSPHIAVFTNFMPDHLNYYSGSMRTYFKDKSAIFSHQTQGDILIASEEATAQIKKYYAKNIASTLVVVPAPRGKGEKGFLMPGEHNRLNGALAIAAASALGVPEEEAYALAKHFKGVPGRLEYMKDVRGVAVYNDTTATTPDAVLAGLRALAKGKNIVLIWGGADKQLKQDLLLKELPEYVKALVLLPGTGIDLVRATLKKISASSGKNIIIEEAVLLPQAVEKALALAKRGDIVLFSPGFASFGLFKNEFDRGDQFIEIVKAYKRKK